MLKSSGNQFARVLVTGGAGFIGCHLVEHLVSLGMHVRVFDNLSTGDASRLPHEVDFREGDVLDRRALASAFDGVDLVFHFASVVGMRLASAESEHAFEVSASGTRNVLELSDSLPIVLPSTSALYGLDDGDRPKAEANAVTYDEVFHCDGGKRGYASGKWQMEALAQAAAEDGRDVLIARPFNVVGPGQTGCYGMVLPRFIDAALAGEPLTIFDDGLQTRSFSDVYTFVRTLVALVSESRSWEPGANTVNIGNPAPTRIIDLANSVVRLAGSSSSLSFVPYTDFFPGRRDTRGRIPDNMHLESLIGPVVWPDINAVVEETIEYVRSIKAHSGRRALQ